MENLYDELFSHPGRFAATSFEECSLCALGKDHSIEEHDICIDDAFSYAPMMTVSILSNGRERF